MKVGIIVPSYALWWRAEGVWAICERGGSLAWTLYCADPIITPQRQSTENDGFTDIWTAMSYVAAVANVWGWSPTLGQS